MVIRLHWTPSAGRVVLVYRFPCVNSRDARNDQSRNGQTAVDYDASCRHRFSRNSRYVRWRAALSTVSPWSRGGGGRIAGFSSGSDRWSVWARDYLWSNGPLAATEILAAREKL